MIPWGKNKTKTKNIICAEPQSKTTYGVRLGNRAEKNKSKQQTRTKVQHGLLPVVMAVGHMPSIHKFVKKCMHWSSARNNLNDERRTSGQSGGKNKSKQQTRTKVQRGLMLVVTAVEHMLSIYKFVKIFMHRSSARNNFADR